MTPPRARLLNPPFFLCTYSNNGNGVLSSCGTLTVANYVPDPADLKLVDLDGDGDLDVMIRLKAGYMDEGKDEVWISDASVGYTGFTLDSTTSFSSLTHAWRGRFYVADLDNEYAPLLQIHAGATVTTCMHPPLLVVSSGSRSRSLSRVEQRRSRCGRPPRPP